jgi:hypothetical protein
MPKQFIYRGPRTPLGRFGMVHKGEVLLLTEAEAVCIHGDKRFEPLAGSDPISAAKEPRVRFIYRGADVNLGRFGAVRRNDVLRLTKQEARGIEGDKRFEPVIEGKTKLPTPGHFLPRFFPGAEQHNRKERERLEQITKANEQTWQL